MTRQYRASAWTSSRGFSSPVGTATATRWLRRSAGPSPTCGGWPPISWAATTPTTSPRTCSSGPTGHCPAFGPRRAAGPGCSRSPAARAPTSSAGPGAGAGSRTGSHAHHDGAVDPGRRRRARSRPAGRRARRGSPRRVRPHPDARVLVRRGRRDLRHRSRHHPLPGRASASGPPRPDARGRHRMTRRASTRAAAATTIALGVPRCHRGAGLGARGRRAGADELPHERHRHRAPGRRAARAGDRPRRQDRAAQRHRITTSSSSATRASRTCGSDRAGTWENARSPAVFLNRSRIPTKEAPHGQYDAKAAPEWRKISDAPVAALARPPHALDGLVGSARGAARSRGARRR